MQKCHVETINCFQKRAATLCFRRLPKPSNWIQCSCTIKWRPLCSYCGLKIIKLAYGIYIWGLWPKNPFDLACTVSLDGVWPIFCGCAISHQVKSLALCRGCASPLNVEQSPLINDHMGSAMTQASDLNKSCLLTRSIRPPCHVNDTTGTIDMLAVGQRLAIMMVVVLSLEAKLSPPNMQILSCVKIFLMVAVVGPWRSSDLTSSSPSCHHLSASLKLLCLSGVRVTEFTFITLRISLFVAPFMSPKTVALVTLLQKLPNQRSWIHQLISSIWLSSLGYDWTPYVVTLWYEYIFRV